MRGSRRFSAVLAGVLAPALLAFPAPASAGRPDGHALMLQPSELAGFAVIAGGSSYTTSAARWTAELEEQGAAGVDELAHLTADGFRAGVMEFLTGRGGSEAIYNGILFATAAGAAQQLSEDVSYDETHYPRAVLHRSRIRGIAGAVVFSGLLAARHEASSNVIFSSGRCSFILADSIHHASAVAQASARTIAAARSVQQRLRRACA
jgi:hypothetical protein